MVHLVYLTTQVPEQGGGPPKLLELEGDGVVGLEYVGFGLEYVGVGLDWYVVDG